MDSTTTVRRHLRVGLVAGKRIVEERVLRDPRAVTFGASARSTFILPPDALARPWRLFEAHRGRLRLRLSPTMTARIAADAEVTSLGVASEPVRTIELGANARGKVTLGETTILFQRVRPPAPHARPQLPSSVRRHVFADLDGTFTSFVTASLLLHLTMVIYLRQVDWPRRPAIDEVPDRFIHEFQKRPRPVPTPPLSTARPEPTQAARAPEAKPARATPEAHAAPKPTPTATERHAALEKQVQKIGFIAYIGARGDGPSPITDLLRDGNADQPVEQALKGVSGVAVAQSDQLRNLPRLGAGGGRVATPTGLRIAGNIAVAGDVGPALERGVKTNLRVDEPTVEDGHADAAAIAREIRARRKAVSACYERALKQQPTLAGKLIVRFSLSAAGTVTAVDIDEDTLGAPDVAACVRATALRWRFPALAEGPAALSFPFVFQPGA
jgi:protein TonB